MAHLFDAALLGPILLAGFTLVWFVIDSTRRVASGAAALTAGAAPERLGPYTLTDKIGEGAMGEVYRAYNSAIGAWRAVKLLPQGATQHDRERFEKEARLGATLRHPHTVSIYEHGEAGQGPCYYAMELVEGVNLRQLVEREGPQPPERVVRILLQLCAALAQAHAQKLVHRDIKPENVLLTGAALETVKLIDFGLLEHVSVVAQGQPEGALIGTPLYISPEAIAAPETVGPRSDLYGLGAVAYFLLRGVPVFQARSLIEICCHHLHTPPEPLSTSLGDALSAGLERIVLDCLAKDPRDRPASATDLARRLACCSEGRAGGRASKPSPLASRNVHLLRARFADEARRASRTPESLAA
jgi:eukaryotic-like serine/threonine-protein kinase